jgi:hypothetical protein
LRLSSKRRSVHQEKEEISANDKMRAGAGFDQHQAPGLVSDYESQVPYNGVWMYAADVTFTTL